MIIIQIRGSNGTGKTTVVRGFLKRTKYTNKDITVNGRSIECHEAGKAFIIGKYDRAACGGCDSSIKNAEELKNVLAYVSRKLKPEIIIFEGVMYGKTKKLGIEIYKFAKSVGARYVAVCLEPEFDKALERIYIRNGGKDVNVKSLVSSWRSSLKSNASIREAGVKTLTFDTGDMTIEETEEILFDVMQKMGVEYE